MITLVSVFRNIGASESDSVKVFAPGEFEESLIQAAAANEPLFIHIKGTNSQGQRFSFVFSVMGFLGFRRSGRVQKGWSLPVTSASLEAYANHPEVRKV